MRVVRALSLTHLVRHPQLGRVLDGLCRNLRDFESGLGHNKPLELRRDGQHLSRELGHGASGASARALPNCSRLPRRLAFAGSGEWVARRRLGAGRVGGAVFAVRASGCCALGNRNAQNGQQSRPAGSASPRTAVGSSPHLRPGRNGIRSVLPALWHPAGPDGLGFGDLLGVQVFVPLPG